MAIDLEDEILQDFLIEAGEILDLLGEQLVELEQSPQDYELLNAIFRGFHTVKGGAGFLAIEPLVHICHQAEDIFNVLRQGDRQVTAELMDVILLVLDVVNGMFEQIRAGEDPDEADPKLLAALAVFNSPQAGDQPSAAEAPRQPAEQEPLADIVGQEFDAMLDDALQDAKDMTATPVTEQQGDEITEQEFEDLLDELHGKGKFSIQPEGTSEAEHAAPADDQITEQEFDDLLDQLHGKGRFSNAADGGAEQASEDSQLIADGSDEISEDEFDELLDKLHGKGKFSQLPRQQETVTAQASAAKPARQEVKAPAVQATTQTPETSPQQVTAGALATKPGGADKPKPAEKKTGKSAAPATETTVRVDTQILDDIMNMVGELVLVRNRFQTLRTAADDEQISKAVANLDVVTADLQLAVMKTRMQPIKKVFGRFPRVVRDLARNLNKEITLELQGEDTDLDKNLVEALADPLVHLVRNSVDHGIELPDVREAAGKPRTGMVVLTASQEGDHIQLTIEDNGQGMDPDVLRNKAVEKGLMDEETASRLDDKECFNLIFAPGFSTKTEISDVSGRGVGMDVVKTRISQMNGTVDIDSRKGRGTVISIKVPLTLAIMPTLMVKLSDQAFALPLASVLEILDLDLRRTNVVDGQMCVVVREKALPLFYLREWLVQGQAMPADPGHHGHVVVVNAGGRHVGFVVDQLIGQEEVVIKPLSAKLQGIDGLAGATITGDGRIALILDVPGLMKRYVV